MFVKKKITYKLKRKLSKRKQQDAFYVRHDAIKKLNASALRDILLTQPLDTNVSVNNPVHVPCPVIDFPL